LDLGKGIRLVFAEGFDEESRLELMDGGRWTPLPEVLATLKPRRQQQLLEIVTEALKQKSRELSLDGAEDIFSLTTSHGIHIGADRPDADDRWTPVSP
jgi:hypothetical protein